MIVSVVTSGFRPTLSCATDRRRCAPAGAIVRSRARSWHPRRRTGRAGPRPARSTRSGGSPPARRRCRRGGTRRRGCGRASARPAETSGPAIHRPAAISATLEHGRQAPRQLLRHLEERHVLTRSGRALHLVVVAIERVQVDQRPDDQDVDRHPDRAAPVGVAAEHAGVRLGGQVLDREVLVGDPEPERVVQVIARERPDPVRAQELLFVEHVAQHARQLFLVQDRQQPAALLPHEALVGRRHVRDQLRMPLPEERDHLGVSSGNFTAGSTSTIVEAQSGSRPTSDRVLVRRAGVIARSNAMSSVSSGGRNAIHAVPSASVDRHARRQRSRTGQNTPTSSSPEDPAREQVLPAGGLAV